MIPQDLAAQFELYAQSNENAYKESMGSAEPGTELHRLRHIYFHWKLERAHTFRLAAEMVRDCLVPKWSPYVPTKPGRYLRRFDKTSPVYMETYVLDEHGVLCYAAHPDDCALYGRPIGPRFQATTKWCEIASPAD